MWPIDVARSAVRVGSSSVDMYCLGKSPTDARSG